ncbi:hypothetical protein PVAND_010673 [Polypedilum vanderplanki]|uniref:G-protein coupled receptors family 1 profile domain-containing protein n=1 Tax=Polypedilum vanderplanki TaxID=319348 RepID=A0A9J6CHJ3_POLVA|nr:hypothetical protein PVAND_010673 [Polypedilum vanderplanki]
MTSFKKSVIIGIVFFGIILLTALTVFYISLGECEVGFFACDNGTICLPQKLVCDFKPDCKDKTDEVPRLCGNLYGSNVVTSNDLKIGINRYVYLKKIYNFTDKSYMDTCAYKIKKIPKNCKCLRVQLISCKNISTIPKFPSHIEMIDLSDNHIALDSYNRFGIYRNLSYLDLRNNKIHHLPSQVFYKANNLAKLFLQNNRITDLPSGFSKHLIALRWLFLNNNHLGDFALRKFKHLQNLQMLNLSINCITLSKNMTFPKLPHLYELFLDGNKIKVLRDNHFKNLINLNLISLRNNQITFINSSVFNSLQFLIEIRLSGNPLINIEQNTFKHLQKLNALYLDYTNVLIDDALLSTINVSFLSLKGIAKEKIEFNAIERVQKLEHIVYKKFSYCSRTSKIKKCYPKTDGISSTSDLLDNVALRYAVWFMACISCIGNISVLWNRFHDENKSVSLVLRNLAISDIMMGFYLIGIGFTDARFRNVYHKNSGTWLQSIECIALGILAVTSSEVSILILTFMSIERFLLISDPFGHHKMDTKIIITSLIVIWMLGTMIAIIPAIMFQSTKFYGVYSSGTCFPLFIEEIYSTAWIYSIVFLGINLILLILIATLYTILLFSIYRTRRATSLNYFDCEVAIRFFFIVLTDISCWAPIILMKLFVLYDIEISGDVYSYLCIFVLPLNATTNPILYTYSTPKYRDKIFSIFKKQRKIDVNSNQIITADDSQTKVSLLLSNSKNSSKWKLFKK